MTQNFLRAGVRVSKHKLFEKKEKKKYGPNNMLHRLIGDAAVEAPTIKDRTTGKKNS